MQETPFLVRDKEAAGLNPASPTNGKRWIPKAVRFYPTAALTALSRALRIMPRAMTASSFKL